MSHFSVLVIGDNVDEQLAPYHEFECTGLDNQYVKEIDKTEEARKEFEAAKTTMIRDTQGNLHSPYTPEGEHHIIFWRSLTESERTGLNKYANHLPDGRRVESRDWENNGLYHQRVYELPEGWAEVEVLTSTVETFAEFCKGYYGHDVVPYGGTPDLKEANKYGYTIVDVNGDVIKTVDRTNPSKKWDWFQVGGRWSGYFKVRPALVPNRTVPPRMGEPGIQTLDKDYAPPGTDRADVITKRDVDVAGMRDEAGEKAASRYDRLRRVIDKHPIPKTWEQMLVQHETGEFYEDGSSKVNFAAAREEYHAQPAIRALAVSEDKDLRWANYADYACTREAYVQNARDEALPTFAVVQDGKWYERGEMLWFASVRDEKDAKDWHQEFNKMFDALPEDTLLTIVDCHI